MKVYGILDDYFHGQIKKTAGDWDDIANVPDIADSVTDENKTPFDGDFWKDKFYNLPESKQINNKKNKINCIA